MVQISRIWIFTGNIVYFTGNGWASVAKLKKQDHSDTEYMHFPAL
jgi:hypothetical protein